MSINTPKNNGEHNAEAVKTLSDNLELWKSKITESHNITKGLFKRTSYTQNVSAVNENKKHEKNGYYIALDQLNTISYTLHDLEIFVNNLTTRFDRGTWCVRPGGPNNGDRFVTFQDAGLFISAAINKILGAGDVVTINPNEQYKYLGYRLSTGEVIINTDVGLGWWTGHRMEGGRLIINSKISLSLEHFTISSSRYGGEIIANGEVIPIPRNDGNAGSDSDFFTPGVHLSSYISSFDKMQSDSEWQDTLRRQGYKTD